MKKNTAPLPLALALLLAAGIATAAPAAQPLKTQLRWVPADLGPGHVTLDASSRLLLARSAARQAGLHEVGLDFRDVYGVINAQTSWLPSGLNIGKPSNSGCVLTCSSPLPSTLTR